MFNGQLPREATLEPARPTAEQQISVYRQRDPSGASSGYRGGWCSLGVGRATVTTSTPVKGTSGEHSNWSRQTEHGASARAWGISQSVARQFVQQFMQKGVQEGC